MSRVRIWTRKVSLGFVGRRKKILGQYFKISLAFSLTCVQHGLWARIPTRVSINVDGCTSRVERNTKKENNSNFGVIELKQNTNCLWNSMWKSALQAGRSRVRFPLASLQFFIDIFLPAAQWPWGWLSSLLKWVPGIFPGGGGGVKAAGA